MCWLRVVTCTRCSVDGCSSQGPFLFLHAECAKEVSDWRVRSKTISLTRSVPERSVSFSKLDIEFERTCDLRKVLSNSLTAKMLEGMFKAC